MPKATTTGGSPSGSNMDPTAVTSDRDDGGHEFRVLEPSCPYLGLPGSEASKPIRTKTSRDMPGIGGRPLS